MTAELDRLDRYRDKRSFDRTPEPGGGEPTNTKAGNRFVIQEHHATRLHWDLRLERNGVLVSWALPRGVPKDPAKNRLAVHTEDHPLDYIDFHGEIPAGEYGAGTMTIWDAGTYEAEKFRADEVILTFHGERVTGRYALFQTRGDDWMIHRMDPPVEGFEPLPDALAPMTAAVAKRVPQKDLEWGFEIEWEGERALAFCETGHMGLLDAAGEDVVKRYPEVRGVLEELGGREALLDGELLAFGDDGRPDPTRLNRRRGAKGGSQLRRLRESTPITYVVFDLLHLEGESFLDRSYEARRETLDKLGLQGPAWQVPAYHRGDGKALLEASRAQGVAGIIGKRLASPYRPGTESRDWRAISA